MESAEPIFMKPHSPNVTIDDYDYWWKAFST